MDDVPFVFDARGAWEADMAAIADLGREAFALQAEAAEISRVAALRRKHHRGVADLVAAWQAPLPAETIPVPERVLAEIARHAGSVDAGFEVGGALVVRSGGVVVRYSPLENLAANEPGRFVLGDGWRRTVPLGFGEKVLVLHSHPRSGERGPSSKDLAGISARSLREPIGIFHCDSGTLSFFRIGTDRRSYSCVPSRILRSAPLAASAVPAPRRGRFTIDYERGVVLDRPGRVVPNGLSVLGAYLRGDVASAATRGPEQSADAARGGRVLKRSA